MAERLLDHHPAPAATSLRHEARRREALDHGTEEAIRNGEVEKIVACRAGGAVQLRQVFTQATERPRIGEIALQIRHAVGKPLPGGLVDVIHLELAVTTGELLHRIGESVAPLLYCPRIMVDCDES